MECKRCEKELRDDFLFCPWCGHGVQLPDEANVIFNHAFDKLASMEASSYIKILSDYDESLRLLETELNELAQQKQGRS